METYKFKASNYCIRDGQEGITIEQATKTNAFDVTVQFNNLSRGPIATLEYFRNMRLLLVWYVGLQSSVMCYG